MRDKFRENLESAIRWSKEELGMKDPVWMSQSDSTYLILNIFDASRRKATFSKDWGDGYVEEVETPFGQSIRALDIAIYHKSAEHRFSDGETIGIIIDRDHLDQFTMEPIEYLLRDF